MPPPSDHRERHQHKSGFPRWRAMRTVMIAVLLLLLWNMWERGCPAAVEVCTSTFKPKPCCLTDQMMNLYSTEELQNITGIGCCWDVL